MPSDLDISYKEFLRPGSRARPCTGRKESWRSAVEMHSRASIRTPHSRTLRPVSRGLPPHASDPFPLHEKNWKASLPSRISRLLSLPITCRRFLKLLGNWWTAAQRTARNDPGARHREQARPGPSHRRNPARPCPASNAGLCPPHFRRILEHFLQTREAHRNPPTMPNQPEGKVRTLSRACDTRRVSPASMRREKA